MNLISIRAFLLSVLLGLTAAGLVSPTKGQAGDLDPKAPPGSTMKTLDEIPPTWSQDLPYYRRFQQVMGGQAVLDKETGLVWEKIPERPIYAWNDAVARCFRKAIGGRMGWRLPTAEELYSLADPSNRSPALPTDDPFNLGLNVIPDVYDLFWSQTSHATNPWESAWFVNFRVGGAYPTSKTAENKHRCWCVRGGHGYNGHFWRLPY